MKRIFAIVLTLCLACTCLTGCEAELKGLFGKAIGRLPATDNSGEMNAVAGKDNANKIAGENITEVENQIVNNAGGITIQPTSDMVVGFEYEGFVKLYYFDQNGYVSAVGAEMGQDSYYANDIQVDTTWEDTVLLAIDDLLDGVSGHDAIINIISYASADSTDKAETIINRMTTELLSKSSARGINISVLVKTDCITITN